MTLTITILEEDKRWKSFRTESESVYKFTSVVKLNFQHDTLSFIVYDPEDDLFREYIRKQSEIVDYTIKES